MINKTIKKFIRLFIGFIFCSIAIVFMINANLGLSPWDVLHQGISTKTGITIGTANIVVGLIIVILDVIFGESLGWGTVFNMIFIGIFIDLIMFSNIIPISTSLTSGIVMLIIGMILMSYGMVLYLGCGLGSGPRDGMMNALQKRTNKPVKTIRTTMEICALIVGYILGGNVGVGTVITAVGLGYIIQIIFKICNFKSESIVHRSIIEDINHVKLYLSKDTDVKIEKENQ